MVALGQFLPGPLSSQLGMAVGCRRAGLPGLLAAWLGFTLPSAVLMIGLASSLGILRGDPGHAGWLRGLKLAAAAVVAQALWTMARKLCPDRSRILVALAAAGTVLVWRAAAVPVVVIAAGPLAGLVIFKAGRGKEAGGSRPEAPGSASTTAGGGGQPGRALGVGSLIAFRLSVADVAARSVVAGRASRRRGRWAGAAVTPPARRGALSGCDAASRLNAEPRLITK